MPKVRDFDFGQICFESDSMQVLSMSHKGRDDSEFPVTQGPINLSVLKSDGLLSHRWGVKTNHKGDAYVYCRDVPRAEKVSLHASGRQHISFTSQTSAHLGADCRFGNVWKEPDFESDAIATFSLVFPPWSAGLRPEERRTLTKDELVIVGHREKLVVVSFFIVDSAKKMQGRLPHFVLGQLPLRRGKTLHIIAWKEPQNNLVDRIRSIFPQASLTFSQLDLGEDDYTLWVQGYRGPNSAYMVTVPIHYTPRSETA